MLCYCSVKRIKYRVRYFKRKHIIEKRIVRLFIRFCSIMKVLTENKTIIITDEVR